MDWLNNANTITSLVMGLIGIGGALYGTVSYLKKKASLPADAENLPNRSSNSAQRLNVPLSAFTWLEWSEFLAQGLADMADFILCLCIEDFDKNDASVMARLGGGMLIYGLGLGVGTFILAIIIGLLFTGLGIHDPSGASGVIAFILLFTVLSFIYVYHVGRCAEQKRREQYQSMKQQQVQRTSVQR